MTSKAIGDAFPAHAKRPMALITTRSNKLPIPDKILKGQVVITRSTTNPNVPGNEEALAAFAEAQEELIRANAEEMAARGTLAAKMTARDDAVSNWMARLNGLGAFTASATAGDAAKIQSAGFSVRSERTPTQMLPAPMGLRARTNGKPGHTQLSWPPLHGAKSYNVQKCADPMTEEGWEFAMSSTTAKVDVNGAEPGQCCWYRVAGVNGKGQGPWSAPVCRPVM